MRRTRDELAFDVIHAVWDATEHDSDGGIVGQQALADQVGCSTSLLTAEMPYIVAKSRELFPGYALQCAPFRTGWQGRPPHRYRIVDEQSPDEIRASRTRGRKGETATRRSVHEIDVRRATPGAKAAVEMIKAGQELQHRGYELLETEESADA